jgi:phosphatidylserine/phosphatidylglycerophosphate/cardiolipin synthase-like enzyme
MLNQPNPAVITEETKIHFLSYKNALIAATRSARHRVWILSYVINANMSRQNDPITLFLHILARHKIIGRDIRVIIDDPDINRPNYHCNKFFMRRLDEMNIPFITPPKKITSHAKAVLIDDRILFIGSHNLAKSSLENPLDCTVELRNKTLIDNFALTYKSLWEDRSMIAYPPGIVPKYKYYG